jgi:putative tricarboxylic transport membrane protein
MSEHVRDRIVGVVLVAFAALWCIVVWTTVPTAYGDAVVGPRDVPLWLGMGLGLLALTLIRRSYWIERAGAVVEKDAPIDRTSEWKAFAVVTVSVIAYALIMDWFGFVVATLVVVFVLLRFALGVRSLRVLVGMPVCMSFGVYFVMGALMGVYLPRGTLISLF